MTCIPDRIRGIRNFLTVTLLVAGYGQPLSAQTYPYSADFETANTSPASKSYASEDTIILGGIPWVMPGVYLGAMTVNDFRTGAHAARMRLSNNSSGEPGYLEMTQDLPSGIDTLHFQTAMYGSETGGRLLVHYSITGGNSWLEAGDTIEVPPHDSPALISRILNQSGAVRIRIQKAENSNARINIDALSLDAYGLTPPVQVLDKQPEGAEIPLSLDSLRLLFDQPVIAGSGTLSLHQVDGGTQVIPIPSSQVTVSDSCAIISGISLENASRYFVLFSDSCFTDLSGTAGNEALSDSSFWTFSTVDTTGPFQAPPLTSLNESFLACNAAQGLMGVFRPLSRKGIQSWSCSGEGHEDYFCIYMSGGFAAGASDSNEDWLISRLPLDLHTYSSPQLSFWQQSRYGGAVMREVRVSASYPGHGDPEAAGVSWTLLNIPGFDDIPPGTWSLVSGIDLGPFREEPFYLAFTYRCAATGAYALYYDDIRVEDPGRTIMPGRKENFSLNILGRAGPQSIIFALEVPEAGVLELEIRDMCGRLLRRENIRLGEGAQVLRVRNLDLRPGVYLVRAGYAGAQVTVKASVW